MSAVKAMLERHALLPISAPMYTLLVWGKYFVAMSSPKRSLGNLFWYTSCKQSILLVKTLPTYMMAPHGMLMETLFPGNGGYGRLGHSVQKDEFTPKAVDALRGRMPVDKESPVSPPCRTHPLMQPLRQNRDSALQLSAAPIHGSVWGESHPTLCQARDGAGRSLSTTALHQGFVLLGCSSLGQWHEVISSMQAACGATSSFCTMIGEQLVSWGKLKASGDNTMYPKVRPGSSLSTGAHTS